MGSLLSTPSATVVQRFARRVTPTTAASPPPPTRAERPSNPHAPITARFRKQQQAQQQQQQQQQQPSLYQRPTTDEWGEALKKMSNVITTSSWDRQQASAADSGSGERPHAQRSAATVQKLPQLRSRMVDSTASKAAGRLSQLDVLQLFKLRRESSHKWDARALSVKFNVEECDVVDLLKFTRTYTGRADKDGLMRGYYNADANNTITRFEKD